MIVVAVILFTLAFLCGLAWFYLLQKEKCDDELLRDVKTQLDRISVNTSDQQLAKQDYFLLNSQANELASKITRSIKQRRELMVLSLVLVLTGIVLFFL